MRLSERAEKSRGFAAPHSPEPKSEGFVRAYDGTRLFCQTFGRSRAPAMVLTDGLACNGTFFAHLIEYFEPAMKIVRWNYRGHGKSAIPADLSHLTIEDCVRDLEAVVAHRRIRKAVHLGFSVGVQVVLDYAHRHPDRVSALVLLCGAPGRILDSFHGNTLLRAALLLLYGWISQGKGNALAGLWHAIVPTNFAYLFASLTEIDPRLIDREHFLPYLEHLASLDLDVFFRLLQSAAEHDTTPFLHETRVPALIIGAKKDTFTPFFLSEAMYQALPDAELLGVPRATHSLPLEQPNLVNLKIEQFLVQRGILSVMQSASISRVNRRRLARARRGISGEQ